jgi:Tfp pilus assembly protein PilW
MSMLRNSSVRGRLREQDEGITLIELVVASALSLTVLCIVAGMFLSTSEAEAQVRGLTRATTSSQLAWNTIDRSVRNSSGLAVTSVSDDMVVNAETVGSAATAVWGCTAFYYSATDNTIRYRTSASAIPVPASTAAQRSWTLLADNVSKTDSIDVFALSINAAKSQTLTTAFTVMASGSTAATISEKSSNTVQTSGSLTCF